VAALLVDLTADCLLLGLLELGPFGGMVPSGKELTRSRMAILNPFSSLSRSSALIFDEAQTITANAALARSRGGNRSSARAPTILCIVAFTVETIPDSLSVAAGPHHSIDRASGPALSDSLWTGSSQKKKASLVPAQCRHFTTSPVVAARPCGHESGHCDTFSRTLEALVYEALRVGSYNQ
jgi:hypothetical protein